MTDNICTMLILAIDTALDACAAALLDTASTKVIAQESQPMKRGHAEALMPLIARVMKESGVAFDALAALPGCVSGFPQRAASRSPPASPWSG